MNQEQRRLYLIKSLLQENPQYQDIEIPSDAKQQKLLLRALFNVRPPQEISPKFKHIQDQYLQTELVNYKITDSASLSKPLAIWQGDITHIKADAIVNAANSGMTGCYAPNHYCIDNAIHTFAGIELRNECNNLMVEQGHNEPTGQAKITNVYNLPSKYVLHTVGPIVEGDKPNKKQEALLVSSYQNCLELAAKNNLKSIVFPCISTGVFHFPNELAAQLAVKTVKEFMQQPSSIFQVVFNVFKEEDKKIYEQLLNQD